MRVLFVTLTNVGDVVLSTVLLNRILESHPQARVDVVCGPAAVDIFKGCPQVNKIYPLKKRKYKLHHLDLLRLGWRGWYDLVVDLRTPLFGYLVPAKKRLMGRPKPNTLMWQHYARLWPGVVPAHTQVWPGAVAAKSAKQWLAKKRLAGTKLVALCPTAKWSGKMWPMAKVAELVESFAKEPVQFVVLGAPHERGQAERIFAALPRKRVIDAFDTTLPEAYTVLAEADVVLANDSGLAHVASATGKPLVVLFGPMDENVYTPAGAQVKVITAPEAKPGTHDLPPYLKPRPMSGIAVKTVREALFKILALNVQRKAS